jgi:hypothetical protein
MCDFRYYNIVVCISRHRDLALALGPAKFKTIHRVEAEFSPFAVHARFVVKNNNLHRNTSRHMLLPPRQLATL